MVALADEWSARGFRTFKVKVGHDLEKDSAALLAVADRVPGARFRLDANAGFTAAEAVTLLRSCLGAGLLIECFEQPCARDDIDGLEAVQAAAPGVPVVADESLHEPADLEAIVARRGRIGGINLKVVKLGGILEALDMGRRARAPASTSWWAAWSRRASACPWRVSGRLLRRGVPRTSTPHGCLRATLSPAAMRPTAGSLHGGARDGPRRVPAARSRQARRRSEPRGSDPRDRERDRPGSG